MLRLAPVGCEPSRGHFGLLLKVWTRLTPLAGVKTFKKVASKTKSAAENLSRGT